MKLDKNQLFAIAKQVIVDEIEGIQQVANRLGDAFLSIIEVILNCSGKVVVSGIGKSGHIGKKIAATLASTGTPAFFLHSTEALHGDLGMVNANDVVIAISYSGESDDLLLLLPALKQKHIIIMAITGNVNSTLATMAHYVLNINVNKEACPLGLAPTTSTTATLVLGDAIAVTLLQARGFKKEDFALSHPGGLLGRKLLTLTSDLMHTGDRLPKVTADSSLKKTVLEISHKGLGFAGVVNGDNQLIGIITDGDLRRLLLSSDDEFNSNILNLQVAEIMSDAPKTLHVNDLAVKAIDLMQQHKITGFLVTDDTNKLIGAFNLHDLLRAKLL